MSTKHQLQIKSDISPQMKYVAFGSNKVFSGVSKATPDPGQKIKLSPSVFVIFLLFNTAVFQILREKVPDLQKQEI